MSTGCGVIVLWWHWLSPAVAICDYHVVVWMIALHSQPHFPGDHTPKSHSTVCHTKEKGAKLCKTNLYGISMGSSLWQTVILQCEIGNIVDWSRDW